MTNLWNEILFDLNQAPEIHDLAEFPVEDQDKPKPIPHESFLTKKAKMEQNPATQSFLDLKLLKRDKDTETEKVVYECASNFITCLAHCKLQ